jgi:transposase
MMPRWCSPKSSGASLGCVMSLPMAAMPGTNLKAALRRIGKWNVEVIKRSDTAKGFEVLPRRWVVERTFAWLNQNRRLAKDFERTIASATTRLFVASVQLLTRRIAKH